MHSIRGYKYGDVSPEDEAGYEYGGDKYLLFNVETTFPLSEEINLEWCYLFDMWTVYRNIKVVFAGGIGLNIFQFFFQVFNTRQS